MHILLTGCAGFIGWKTAELLLDEGHRITGIDNLSDQYDCRIKSWRLEQLKPRSRFSFQKCDIEDGSALERLFGANAFDAVMNLAARGGVRASLANPHLYLGANAVGNLNVLECMRRHGIAKYVLSSTSSLYAGQEMPFRESLPVNEPISPYAASKKSAEAMAFTYHHLYGIDVSVLRYFTVYGPAGRPDMAPLRFVHCIDRGKSITLYGDGSQSRDFTYIDDIAEGTVLALKKVGFEIINLGGGRDPISINDLIDELATQLGKRAVVEQRPFLKVDMRHTWADISKARSLLGWEPKTTFEEGARNLVQWYRAEKEWVRQMEF